MIKTFWIYWVWILVSGILVYVLLNCVYRMSRRRRRTGRKVEYPWWAFLAFAICPFVPVLNFVCVVMCCYQLSMLEKQERIYLRGWIFSKDDADEEAGLDDLDDEDEGDYEEVQKAPKARPVPPPKPPVFPLPPAKRGKKRK